MRCMNVATQPRDWLASGACSSSMGAAEQTLNRNAEAALAGTAGAGPAGEGGEAARGWLEHATKSKAAKIIVLMLVTTRSASRGRAQAPLGGTVFSRDGR